MSVYETIVAMAEEMKPAMVTRRRDFHKHAETGWLEMRTSSLIARRLTELGYEVLTGEDVCLAEARMGVPSQEKLEAGYARAIEQGADPEFVEATRGGMTGVIGILRCGEGPTVAMRFDIDALGVFESDEADHVPAAEGFASINNGSMHACGHDGHGTIGLGVAEVLMAVKDSLHGTVKLIFQPAEEGVRGAKSIVEKGHLDGVDYVIGSHIAAPYGDADIGPGAFGSLATGKYDVVFRGKAAHAGGSPQLGNNALLAAASAVVNLYAIPRHSDGPTRINVGTLVAGSGRNVIADEAKMEIEVRGQTTDINDFVCNYAVRILENTAAMHGCTCEIKLMGAAESLTSDEEFALRIAKVCGEKVGLKSCDPVMVRSGGSEDFAYMMNRVQSQGGKAAFVRVFTTTAAGAHNRRYNFDEEVLVKGVKMFSAVACDLLA